MPWHEREDDPRPEARCGASAPSPFGECFSPSGNRHRTPRSTNPLAMRLLSRSASWPRSRCPRPHPPRIFRFYRPLPRGPRLASHHCRSRGRGHDRHRFFRPPSRGCERGASIVVTRGATGANSAVKTGRPTSRPSLATDASFPFLTTAPGRNSISSPSTTVR